MTRECALETVIGLGARSAVAGSRVNVIRASLARCDLCAHHCHVNRLAGEEGPCHAGIRARIFSAQVEVADELELVPTFAIAYSGCDLRCDFCILTPNSWDAKGGLPIDYDVLSQAATDALDHGARTIMFLGGEPAIHLPDVLEVVSRLPDDATLVWKTNGHSSQTANEWLDGLFDIWNVDFKFGNDRCAERLARVRNYTQTLHQTLRWARSHTRLIVRHLVMPGHIDCCWTPIASWLAENFPGVEVNLRSGFWPAWRSSRHPELCSPTSASDSSRAFKIARDYNLRLIE